MFPIYRYFFLNKLYNYKKRGPKYVSPVLGQYYNRMLTWRISIIFDHAKRFLMRLAVMLFGFIVTHRVALIWHHISTESTICLCVHLPLL